MGALQLCAEAPRRRQHWAARFELKSTRAPPRRRSTGCVAAVGLGATAPHTYQLQMDGQHGGTARGWAAARCAHGCGAAPASNPGAARSWFDTGWAGGGPGGVKHRGWPTHPPPPPPHHHHQRNFGGWLRCTGARLRQRAAPRRVHGAPAGRRWRPHRRRLLLVFQRRRHSRGCAAAPLGTGARPTAGHTVAFLCTVCKGRMGI